MVLADNIEDFERELYRQEKSEYTIEKYRRDIQLYVEFIGRRNLSGFWTRPGGQAIVFSVFGVLLNRDPSFKIEVLHGGVLPLEVGQRPGDGAVQKEKPPRAGGGRLEGHDRGVFPGERHQIRARFLHKKRKAPGQKQYLETKEKTLREGQCGSRQGIPP